MEAAVRRDIQAGHFGKTALLTSGEESRGVIYYGDLMLNYTITDYSVTERGRSQRSPYTYGTTASFSISVFGRKAPAFDPDGVRRPPGEFLLFLFQRGPPP